MDFGDWLENTTRRWQANPNGQRYGQFLWNSLHSVRPDLAVKFHKTKLDPFYTEDARKIGDFIIEVGLIW